MPFCLLPFILHDRENIVSEKLAEVFHGNAYVDVVVYLHCNAYAIALSDTEASGEDNVILDSMLLDRLFQKLDYILRSLEMTG